ncbi:hypothetical protein, partial [Streptomyces sp. NPDC052015]|uniref:hypothetical protein n=1 Tax=Streptomyces sp. NPDC052015 TaxID=3154755 RepID=UPI003436CAC6
WLVTTRVTDYWDRVKKDREMYLAAAQDFQRLYGEFFAIWKTWSTLNRPKFGRDLLAAPGACLITHRHVQRLC